MRYDSSKREATMTTFAKPIARRLVMVSVLALAAAACRPGLEEGSGRVAGWSIIDATQRHPIMVSQRPSTLKLSVARGSYGLTRSQRLRLADFLEVFRSRDANNSKLIIEAPSGGSNEVAAMRVVSETRHFITSMGFDPSTIRVDSYHVGRRSSPPVKVSYLRYVAEGPECGRWPTNLARSQANLNYPNLGCAQQQNLAAMIANPADLLGPRTETPRPAERRTTVWDKYIKGESTISRKQADEKASVKE